MAVMDLLAEDDGPVVLERRRSRHGNYYEEIPPEPEPVPVQPEPVPEVPGLVHVPVGEPGQVLKQWTGTSTDIKLVGTWNPTTTTGDSWNNTSGYSISLNDVIGSYKGHIIGGANGYQPVSTGFGSIEGVYDPAPNCDHNQTASHYGKTQCVDCGTSWPDKAATKECSHTYWTDVGTTKFTFPKDGKGGMSHQPVKCADCGHEWIQDRQF